MHAMRVVYLLGLGAMIGIEIGVGMLMAPVIFYPASFLGEGVLSHYQSGILMTQVFLRFNMVLFVMTLFGLIYEALLFKQGNGDRWALGLTLVMVYAAGMFIFYYTPFIVEAQALGAEVTQTEAFRAMHKGSEKIIKILLVAQVIVFGRRVWLKR